MKYIVSPKNKTSHRDEKKECLISDKIQNVFLRILRTVVGNDTLPDFSDFTESDWKRLFQLSDQQNLLPLIIHEIGRSGKQLYDPDQNRYQVRAMKLAAIQEKNTGRFLRLYKRFGEAGIFPLVVKGITCRMLYGEKENFRTSGDEDFYIRREEYDSVKKILEQEGFALDNKRYEFYDLEGVKEISYVKKSPSMTVEVHFLLIGQDTENKKRMELFFQDIWERSVFRDIHGVNVRVMDPTDHIMMLLFHLFNHFSGYGIGIRHVMDLMLSLREYEEDLDWGKIQEQLEENGMTVLAGDLFYIGKHNLGFDVWIPEMLEGMKYPDILLDDILKDGIFGNQEISVYKMMSVQYAAASMHGKKGAPYNTFHNLLYAAFPPREYFEISYPWIKKKPYLIFLLWGRRWWRFLLRLVSSVITGRSSDIGDGMARLELLKKYQIIS